MNYDGSSDDGQNGRPEAAGSEGPGAFAPIVLTAQSGRDILIPDGAWILGGEYVRQGPDLVIKGTDGQLVVVRGFFNLASPPDLHTDGGAVINAQLATRLAGPLAPGEVAQAGPQAGAGEPIGKVTTATGVVEATHANGTKVTLKTGDPVYQGDVLETGKNGAVGIEFADQSTFSLGDSGRMVLDEMVYDPGGAAQNNSFAMSLVQGTFSFVSGQISKTDPEAMVLNTPVATIGIRGTTIAGKVGGEGQENTLSLLPDAGGSTGEIVISNAAGTVVLNTVGATVTVVSVNQAPPPPVTLSPQELATRYDNVLTVNPAQPQANPDGTTQDQGPPLDVINALNEIGEQLNKAVIQGLEQHQQHQIQLEQVKLNIFDILRPPPIDPLPFQKQFQEQFGQDYRSLTENHALKLDGSGDSVEIGIDGTFATGSDDFTIEAWIKTSYTGARQDIFSFGNAAGTTNTGGYFYVDHTTGNLRYGQSMVFGPTGGAVADGAWHHVAVTNTSGTMQLYIDGTASGASKSMAPNMTSGSAVIGRSVIGAINYFNGQIDEVRVWDKARTQSEIQTDMDRQLNGDEANLTGYWDFNEGAGNIAADGSANNNDGTLVGDAAHEDLSSIDMANFQTYKGMLLGEDAGLSYAVSSNPDAGTFTLDTNHNTYTYVSDASDGDHTVSIDVTDSHGQTSTGTLTFHVT